MSLQRNAYKALESVVGVEHISEDPAVLLGYNHGGQTFDLYSPFGPIAVVLPGSTEEVSAIVKVCNRYDIKYKAHSTGYGFFGMPHVEGVVMVDLRRMDKLVIDEKNQMAVIEPYVTASQLQAEAMKRGLNCHIVTCGGSHSPLASATSLQGISSTGLNFSQNGRNLLGAEWVLPTGEIVKVGSPGCDAGWFSGDGPGPSLRGIIRGTKGACGGLGIFTKIGYKLYPWAGPAEVKRTGEFPQIGWEVPENFKYCYPFWKKWEDMTEGIYRITEERVAYILNRIPPNQMSWAFARNNNEIYDLHQNDTLHFKKKHRMGVNIIVGARRESEFKYKMKALEKIVEDTNGEFHTFTPEQEAFLFGYHLHNDYVVRGARMTRGGFGTSFGQYESISLLKKVMETGEMLLAQDYMKSELMEISRPEGFWGWATEGRHWWQENSFLLRTRNVPVAQQYGFTSFDMICKGKGGLGVPALLLHAELIDMFGPYMCNVQDWMRKIKNTFDPKNSSDHGLYISPEPPKQNEA